MIDVLKKILDERSLKKLNRFANKVQKTNEKYNFMQSFEEKSYV